jgi:transcriptional regulator
MAATNDAPNVRAYAEIARSFQTARLNTGQVRELAFKKHAPSGKTTRIVKYVKAKLSVGVKPGKMRRCLMFGP